MRRGGKQENNETPKKRREEENHDVFLYRIEGGMNGKANIHFTKKIKAKIAFKYKRRGINNPKKNKPEKSQKK